MVIKFFNLIFFNLILLYCSTIYSSQIYDYQTEKFIEKINAEVISVNKYKKKINFKIINNPFPNAFVTENSTLYLTSGLIIHCPDYVSLLAVLAHEIGHLENYHVSKRKNEVNNLKKINSFGNIVAIAGSMLIQQPELINTILINETAISNLYIGFTKEQEKEADFYAIETLNKLNLPSDSLKEFLLILENLTKIDLIDNELKRFSTHPLFKERIKIIDSKKKINKNNFNQINQNEFNFIKAKFMAYTDSEFYYNLKKENKIYYEAIQQSKSGNLFESLKKINLLISKYGTGSFIAETKADILLSYGYNKEAIKFYRALLINYPKNNYIKYNIFTNTIFDYEDDNVMKKVFLNNYNLISLFPTDQILISKLYKISQYLEYSEWNLFFEIILFHKNDLKNQLNKLVKNIKDSNLKNIIKIYI